MHGKLTEQSSGDRTRGQGGQNDYKQNTKQPQRDEITTKYLFQSGFLAPVLKWSGGPVYMSVHRGPLSHACLYVVHFAVSKCLILTMVQHVWVQEK